MYFIILCISLHFCLTVQSDVDKIKYRFLLMYRSFHIHQFSILSPFCSYCMLMVIKFCLREWICPAVFVEFFLLECKGFFSKMKLHIYSGVIIYFVFVWFTARPNPPFDLELTGQLERSVELSWIPGDENNSPITSMFVSVAIC